MRAPFIALALLAALCSSCLSLTWTRQLAETVIRIDDVERLPADAELSDCLALFGAPLFVWERPSESYALAYGWQRQRDLGVSVSIPVSNSASASFQYGEGESNARGLVLFFDAEDRLQGWRFGFLRELTPSPQQL